MGNVKIIGASAGSGKTYRLAYEYVKGVVGNPLLYRNILAVTFTNKATEEMKSRILARIHELASGEPSDYLDRLRTELGLSEERIRANALEAQKRILHDYSHFAILTIDRFFQRLIRAFIRELGVDVAYNLELETDSLLSLAADTLIEDISTDETLREELFEVARDRIEENKRWSVKEPLLGIGRELFGEEYQCAREGAPDEGQTRTLIEGIVAKAEAVHKQIIATAAEAVEIIASNGLSAVDFKDKSRSVAVYFSQVADGDIKPLSQSARKVLESDEWAHKDSPLAGVADSLVPRLMPLLQEIDELVTDNARFLKSAELLQENYRNFLLLGDLQRRVEQICAEENIMPISETNRLIAALVAGNDTPFIFEKAGNAYSRFMIDEFQDTSALQWANFVPLLRNAISGEEGDPVLLIGDVKQAIYRWRGGDWQILSHRVYEDMGRDRVASETLDTNYRSAREVVEFNNAIVELVTTGDNAELNATVDKAVASGAIDTAEADELRDLLAVAYSDHTQKSKPDAGKGYVTVTIYDRDAEGEYTPPVISKIEELQQRGYAPGDIAVLVRSNDHGRQIAQMLLEHKHAHPSSPYGYDVVTQEALTVGAARVARFIVACLSLAVNPTDSIQRAVYNRWTGKGFGQPLAADDERFFAHTARLTPEEAFEEIVMRYGLQSRAEDVAYIQAIHEQICTFAARTVADIPLFLAWWNEKGYKQSITMQAGGSAITVSTIHKSKGLQYKAVIVPYLSWKLSGSGIVWAQGSEGGLEEAGRLPIRYKQDMADSFFAAKYYRELVMSHIDAVNMFYVAVTRAERELHLMMSADPKNGGRISNLVGKVLFRDEEGVAVGDVRGLVTRAEDGTELMEFGSPTIRQGRAPSAATSLHSYPTSRPGTRVRLRLPSARYTEDGALDLAPRDFGVMMHKVFENAVGEADIRLALDRMQTSGTLSPEEHSRLVARIEQAFANPLVAEWFGGEWDVVRNEGDIILPRAYSVKRPDRVMLQGSRAVVVDYKFGSHQLPSHRRQTAEYAALLRDMGYTEVRGYIWYVSLDEIVEV
ncbi:MAG: UvrD-helicase domain-containing protein [Rikenellaceae bacterium]|jgi:ATP-dependent exoDNAse (exonuclease V) beta subunit|nr:UvrD-helicase domain-containing protein [Rikenellaceae bacterium]